MKLFFDENEFQNLLKNLKIEKTVSGGSVANSIVGISQLGDKAGFIGKISDDEFGSNYEDGLKKENVEYFYSKKKEELPTGTCLILVTPDSERTMCTFLGTAGKINENDVSSDAIKKSEIIFYGREYCKARDCYGLSCKICTTCYPNRKKPVITKKA